MLTFCTLPTLFKSYLLRLLSKSVITNKNQKEGKLLTIRRNWLNTLVEYWYRSSLRLFNLKNNDQNTEQKKKERLIRTLSEFDWQSSIFFNTVESRYNKIDIAIKIFNCSGNFVVAESTNNGASWHIEKLRFEIFLIVNWELGEKPKSLVIFAFFLPLVEPAIGRKELPRDTLPAPDRQTNDRVTQERLTAVCSKSALPQLDSHCSCNFLARFHRWLKWGPR